MKAYGVNELRELFLSFFESKGHLRLKSFSLVPQNDNSLLLINAGMAPLKPYFTGAETPPRNRVCTCQKCIRTGDIENVGKTARHGTFFEMLGNFSFGDYFKEEALSWSWEFLTRVLGMEETRLYPSVYLEDEEAYRIWNEQIKVPKERIYRFGKEDNFWEHGAGPCGPCSEIYYDRGEKYGCGKPTCAPGCDCDRFVEIWNNVFTQFEGDGKGGYTELSKKNIDTGMGLERLAVACQDVPSIFDIDTVRAVREAVCGLAGKTYGAAAKDDISIRVITDHVRSVTFMTSDGILPSNEGRGYVLRRLLRRAARHGRMLGIDRLFLTEIAKVVIDCSKDAYPELSEKSEHILRILQAEEEKFYQTLDGGLAILSQYMEELKEAGETALSGEKAFKLYDTYGFPPDLTREILEENGLSFVQEGFEEAMRAQKERARSARGETNYSGKEETVYDRLDKSWSTSFTGYESLKEEKEVIRALTAEDTEVDTAEKGQRITLFTEKTPFYGMMGGQVGDIGRVVTESGVMQVEDTLHTPGGKIGHVGIVTEGKIRKGQMASLEVDCAYRLAVARNHTATHLLQQALRDTLGTHVEQAGSLVESGRLRFDFTHFEALRPDELSAIEARVNEQILAALPVVTREMSMEEAKKTGAMALFGEKYGEKVRVVFMGDYSTELCGGTHLKNTAQAGSFAIVSESGIAAGVRRIEAVTGEGALQLYKEQQELIRRAAEVLKTPKENLVQAAETLQERLKDMKQKLDQAQAKLAAGSASEVLEKAYEIGGIRVLVTEVPGAEASQLRDMGDSLKEKLGESVIVLLGGSEKLALLCMATEGAVEKGAHAGQIIKEAAAAAGGGGGGRPGMAQAGGALEKVKEAEEAAKKAIETQLG